MILNKYTKILLYGGNLWFLGEGMFGPLLAVFTEKIGGSILDVSYAWATYLMVTGVLIIVCGAVSDKHCSKERLMVGGYALNTCFTFLYLFVETPFQMLLVQAGLGLANALSVPTWNALYARYENKDHGGYTWGLAAGEALFIRGVAMLIGGFIVTRYSFTALFLTMGIIQTISTVYQAQILRK